MKVELDCLPCLYRQTLEASRMTTDNKDLIKEIMNDYARLVPEIDDNTVSPAIAQKIQAIIKEKTKTKDPYQNFKRKHIKLAQSLYPKVKKIIAEQENSLIGSLIMSAAGNSIDAGVELEVNVEENIKRALNNGFTYSDFDLFVEKLNPDSEVLIIGDNSGEAVFDKLLIKELNKQKANVTYAVREEPVLNDITKVEAKEIGLTEISNVISSGCKSPGTIFEETTEEFKEAFQKADIIISKGQGNFEGLSELKEEIFFLLKAKCSLIAQKSEVKKGDLVFKLLK